MYLEEQDITHKQTAAYSHESNGIAERYNQTLPAMVRPAWEHVPPLLWAGAYTWAWYINNRLPHSALNGITAHEADYNAKRYISYLRPFYTKCYAHIDKQKCTSGSKLEPTLIAGRLVGYTDHGTMLRIYLPLKLKSDTVGKVKFDLSSHTSVD